MSRFTRNNWRKSSSFTMKLKRYSIDMNAFIVSIVTFSRNRNQASKSFSLVLRVQLLLIAVILRNQMQVQQQQQLQQFTRINRIQQEKVTWSLVIRAANSSRNRINNIIRVPCKFLWIGMAWSRVCVIDSSLFSRLSGWFEWRSHKRFQLLIRSILERLTLLFHRWLRCR